MLRSRPQPRVSWHGWQGVSVAIDPLEPMSSVGVARIRAAARAMWLAVPFRPVGILGPRGIAFLSNLSIGYRVWPREPRPEQPVWGRGTEGQRRGGRRVSLGLTCRRKPNISLSGASTCRRGRHGRDKGRVGTLESRGPGLCEDVKMLIGRRGDFTGRRTSVSFSLAVCDA